MFGGFVLLMSVRFLIQRIYFRAFLGVMAVLLSGWCQATPSDIPVDLYIMPKCPAGLDALRTLLAVRKDFGQALDFRVHFIGNRIAGSSGTTLADFTSLHGVEELDTTVACVLISQLYPGQYFFFLEALAESDEVTWREAAGIADIDAEEIGRLREDPYTLALLDTMFSDAVSRQITRSPTLLVEDRPFNRNVRRDTVLQNVCAKAKALGVQLPGCASAPECLEDSDCGAPDGATAWCEASACHQEVEAPVRMRILTSGLLHEAHVQPSVDLIRQALPSLREEYVLVERPEGAALAAEVGAVTLPVFVFDAAAAGCRRFSQLSKYPIKPGPNGLLILGACPVSVPFPAYGTLEFDDSGKVTHLFDEGYRAFALQGINRPDEAEGLYLAYLEQHPQEIDALKNLGVLYMGRDEFDKAVAYLEKAAAIKPGDVDVYDKLLDVCKKSGRSEIRKGVLFRKALALRDGGLLEQACGALKETLAIDPEDGRAQGALGSLLLGLGKPEESIPHLEKSLQTVTPPSAEIMNCLAGAYLRTNRIEDALAQYNRALDLNPDDPLIATNLANVYDRLGSPLNSIEVLANKTEAYRSSVDAAALLIDLLRRTGQTQQGIALVRELESSLMGGAPLILFRAAECFAEVGDRDSAKRCIKTAIAKENLRVDLCSALADACIGLGMPDDAVACLSSLLRTIPNDARSHALLCFLCCIEGRKDMESAMKHAEYSLQFGLEAEGWRTAREEVSNSFQLETTLLSEVEVVRLKYHQKDTER